MNSFNSTDGVPSTGSHAGKHRIFEGVAASPGIAIAPSFVLARSDLGMKVYALEKEEVESEIRRFHRGVKATKREIEAQREQIAGSVDASVVQIFDSHTLLLEDPHLIEKTEERISGQMLNAESVLANLIEEWAEQLEKKMPESRIASVADDVRQVGRLILSNMVSVSGRKTVRPSEPSIVVAHDLAPSQTTGMSGEPVAGFVTDIGGPVSHVALVAKALEIPAVVGLGSISREVAPGTPMIIDGFEGKVIVNPTDDEIRDYKKVRRSSIARLSALDRFKSMPAETRDGYLVDISANIELPSEVDHVLMHGAEGIGLFRTEFLYLESDGPPTEEYQFKVYRSVLNKMGERPVVFRTVDLGGDKFLSDVTLDQEINPFLGLRAIRLCLQHPNILKTQLRAMLRASHYGKARIMFPLVTGVGEVREAKSILRDMCRELQAEGVSFDPDVEIGTMIEVPSAAMTADAIAKEVDFFSIGTNDLIQYTLAVDRANEQVAHLYEPCHPSVLRLIRDTINHAHRNGIWCGLCGEMSGDPDLACVLIGMGIDGLSMAAGAIPIVKQRVRKVTLGELQDLALEILDQPTSAEVREVLEERVRTITRRRRR